MDKIVIGIDQSYKCTGIALSYNGKLKSATCIKTEHLKNNSEKRETIRNYIATVFNKAFDLSVKYNCPVTVIIERIRLRSQGFINIDYIKSIGALNALMVDVAYIYDFPVYSADTRAWKSAVIGTSKTKSNKYGFDPHKWPTILWCISQGYKDYIIEHVSNRQTKAVIEKEGERYTYNDNIADSIGISLYGFTKSPKLQEEH